MIAVHRLRSGLHASEKFFQAVLACCGTQGWRNGAGGIDRQAEIEGGPGVRLSPDNGYRLNRCPHLPLGLAAQQGPGERSLHRSIARLAGIHVQFL